MVKGVMVKLSGGGLFFCSFFSSFFLFDLTKSSIVYENVSSNNCFVLVMVSLTYVLTRASFY